MSVIKEITTPKGNTQWECMLSDRKYYGKVCEGPPEEGTREDVIKYFQDYEKHLSGKEDPFIIDNGTIQFNSEGKPNHEW